uniref:KIAA1614 n=3 Tax=Homo sapiens TaxID=9606 RepID=A0AAQ5BGG4_HUMAN
MEGTEAAAAKPAGGSPQGPKTGSGTASPVEGTSAVEWSGPEPQLDNGHPPRPWPCPQENRTSSLMAPQPPRVWGVQLQGPSVLESKVRALKEKMTVAKQGVSPCSASQEWSSPKKPQCRRGKAGRAGTPSEGSFLPGAVVAPRTQNLPDGQLDGSINEEQPARDGGPRLPRPPAPGREYCNRGSPWPPEAEWTLPDHDRGPLLGPSSLQQSPIHGVTPGRPGGPGHCNKIIHIPSPRTGRSYPFPDGVVTEADLDSTSLTSEEVFVPRTALLGERWRAGDLEALGAGSSVLSLSDRVERNRLLLQEMLNVSGQSPRKVGTPAWTPSWDTAAPERPVGDVDWASGTSLQDSGQNRTVGPNPEPVLSPRHEEATHLLQRARMKARTRPLRASHDIVPTITQGSRRTPGLSWLSRCCHHQLHGHHPLPVLRGVRVQQGIRGKPAEDRVRIWRTCAVKSISRSWHRTRLPLGCPFGPEQEKEQQHSLHPGAEKALLSPGPEFPAQAGQVPQLQCGAVAARPAWPDVTVQGPIVTIPAPGVTLSPASESCLFSEPPFSAEQQGEPVQPLPGSRARGPQCSWQAGQDFTTACPQCGGRGCSQPGSHRGPPGGGVPRRHQPAAAAALPRGHFRLLRGLWEWAPRLRDLRAGDG